MSASDITELHWQPSGSTDAWLPLYPAPAQNSGFVEAKRYLFERPGAGWTLEIDDEPLAVDPATAASWCWEPRFFAGEVTAKLTAPNGFEGGLFLLDVAPEPTKMGRQVFDRMVMDLWQTDPLLVIGTEPGTRQIGELGTTQNAWLEFARFRRYAPEFLRAASLVRSNPRRSLTVRRIAAPLHRVRHVDARTALSLARSPAVALLTGKARLRRSAAGDERLDVPFNEETLDCAANRAMLAVLNALVRRGRSLLERLPDLVSKERDVETRTSLAARWPTRRLATEALVIHLKALSRQLPFSAVKRSEITAAGLTAIAADPGYARAWGRAWRALRQGVEVGTGVERLWMSPSWEIYERWCFLRIGQLLAAVLPAWNWQRSSDRWVGRSSDRAAELRLQPTFRSSPEEIDGMWSISGERVPDLVLTVRSPESTRFVVLDAKYRVTRSNVLDAMTSAHVYQDSLRIGARRPEASLLLVPAGGGTPWMEAPTFQSTHRVGVCVLAPDRDLQIPEPIKTVLEL